MTNSTEATPRCLIDRDGSVAILTIDNQARRNALSQSIRDEMLAYMQELSEDKSCRAIIVTGAGSFFCSGADVKSMTAAPAYSPGLPELVYGRASRGTASQLMRLFVAGPKPVIAAVEGGAFGVGLSLASAADYIVSTPAARFQVAQLRRGIIPDGGMFYLMTARCGLGRARELLASGREFNGVEAERYGMVHELVEPGQVLSAAMKVAQRYAELPPLSVAFTKSALAYNSETLDAAIEAERHFQPIVHASTDHKEAVSAFLEKRAPTFIGE